MKEHYPERVPDMDEVQKDVLNLNTKNSSTSYTIHGAILKQTVDVNLQSFTNSINHGL